jgi:GT2 family glycosyltransferase
LKLSIIIIHYNTSGDLGRCLESIAACPPDCTYQILVVDNASTDAGLAQVREKHPDVEWIMNTQNAGYSRGVNQGLEAVAAEYSLILNPDIVILPRAIDRLLERAEANSRAGILGPQLLNTDGSIQDSCRRFYTLATLLMRRTPLGKIFRNNKSVDDHLMRDFDHLSERPVDWVLGGCMLVRRSAVERVGRMDERFFLYFEDVDWCWRMGRGGYDVLYVPDARFEHRHRRDSAGGPTKKSFWMHLGSLISFYEKWGMLAWLLKRWRDPLQTLLLWLTDIIALNVAFAGAYVLRAAMNPLFPESLFPFNEYRPLQIFATLLASAGFTFMGRYRPGSSRRPLPVKRWLQQVGMISLLLLASTWLSHQAVYSRAVLLLFIPLFGLSSYFSSRFHRWLTDRMEKGSLTLERTVFVGTPHQVEAWSRRGRKSREAGLDPVGFLLPDHVGFDASSVVIDDLPCLGSVKGIIDIVERYHVSQVVYWDWPRGELQALHSLSRLRDRRVRLRWLVEEAALVDLGARADDFADAPSIVLDPDMKAMPSLLLERVGHIMAGVLLLLIGLPGVLIGRVLAGCSVRDFKFENDQDRRHNLQLKIVLDERKGVAKLALQPWLGWALLTSKLNIWGPRLILPGEAEHQTLRQAWQLDRSRPGLTGEWAAADLRTRLLSLWHDPAGLSILKDGLSVED